MGEIEEIARKMQEALQDLHRLAGKYAAESLMGAIDPSALLRALKGMGIDASALSGTGLAGQVDPYTVLGLDSSAGDDEVKARYHSLLRRLHPDTAGVEGTGFFLQQALAAYQVIKKERGWS